MISSKRAARNTDEAVNRIVDDVLIMLHKEILDLERQN